MAVGSDEMVDLDSIEARLDERPAAAATGTNLLETNVSSGIARGR